MEREKSLKEDLESRDAKNIHPKMHSSRSKDVHHSRDITSFAYGHILKWEQVYD